MNAYTEKMRIVLIHILKWCSHSSITHNLTCPLTRSCKYGKHTHTYWYRPSTVDFFLQEFYTQPWTYTSEFSRITMDCVCVCVSSNYLTMDYPPTPTYVHVWKEEKIGEIRISPNIEKQEWRDTLEQVDIWWRFSVQYTLLSQIFGTSTQSAMRSSSITYIDSIILP